MPVGDIRRVAASVPTNIAEGSNRRINAAKDGRLLNIAEGSRAGTAYFPILSPDIEHFSADQIASGCSRRPTRSREYFTTYR